VCATASASHQQGIASDDTLMISKEAIPCSLTSLWREPGAGADEHASMRERWALEVNAGFSWADMFTQWQRAQAELGVSSALLPVAVLPNGTALPCATLASYLSGDTSHVLARGAKLPTHVLTYAARLQGSRGVAFGGIYHLRSDCHARPIVSALETCRAAIGGVLLVYVRVWKSGNDAICTHLAKIHDRSIHLLDDYDLTSSELVSHRGERRERAPTIVFTVVREPIARLISAYGEVALRATSAKHRDVYDGNQRWQHLQPHLQGGSWYSFFDSMQQADGQAGGRQAAGRWQQAKAAARSSRQWHAADGSTRQAAAIANRLRQAAKAADRSSRQQQATASSGRKLQAVARAGLARPLATVAARAFLFDMLSLRLHPSGDTTDLHAWPQVSFLHARSQASCDDSTKTHKSIAARVVDGPPRAFDLIARSDRLNELWTVLASRVRRMQHERVDPLVWPAFDMTSGKHTHLDVHRNAMATLLRTHTPSARAVCMIFLPDFLCFGFALPAACAGIVEEFARGHAHLNSSSSVSALCPRPIADAIP